MSARRAPAQSLIEFALLAPVLLVLAVAVWDGGSVLREQLILDAAARAGARLTATGYGTVTRDDVVSAVRTAGADLALGAADQVTVTPLDPIQGTVTPGAATVTVSHTHALYAPLLRLLWGNGSGTVTLKAQASFYVPAPLLSPTLVPAPAPAAGASPAPCTFDLKIPALDNNSGWFSPPFQLAARDTEPGYFVGRILVNWTIPGGTANIQLAVFGGNPFASMQNPTIGSQFAADKLSGQRMVLKQGGPIDSLSVIATGQPVTSPGPTYTAYFFNYGASITQTSVGTVTFLKAGCPS